MLFDPKKRPLFAAICLSAALHLLALFGDGYVRTRPVATAAAVPPLQVTVHAAPALERELPRPLVRPPPPPPARNERMPRVVGAAAPAPVALPAPASPASPAAAPPAAPAPAATTTGEARPAASPGGEPAVQAAAAPSADGLRQYRIDLAGAARRFRNYPVLARSRGWEGVVELTVSTAAGMPPSVRLGRSSGFPVLDDQAQDMLSRAVAQTPLPESLRGRSFSVVLPIRFSLDE